MAHSDWDLSCAVDPVAQLPEGLGGQVFIDIVEDGKGDLRPI
jgi:hypothetical protein